MRIYVASSWKNTEQPYVVKMLNNAGHLVYDFKNPAGKTGFSWQQVVEGKIDTLAKYHEALRHPIAAQGYLSDYRAMEWADACVLVLPCGRSAHLEAGWFAGRGKRLIILTKDGEEPELMALMAQAIVGNISDVLYELK